MLARMSAMRRLLIHLVRSLLKTHGTAVSTGRIVHAKLYRAEDLREYHHIMHIMASTYNWTTYVSQLLFSCS